MDGLQMETHTKSEPEGASAMPTVPTSPLAEETQARGVMTCPSSHSTNQHTGPGEGNADVGEETRPYKIIPEKQIPAFRGHFFLRSSKHPTIMPLQPSHL